MLSVKTVDFNSEYYADVKRLYDEAFPENERGPLDELACDFSGSSELLAFFDGDVFCGFASLLNLDDISHIEYFAVEKPLRSLGYGSAILTAIKRLKMQCRIIADIEALSPDSSNLQDRERRKKFYFKNGFSPTKIAYVWQGEAYELLCFNGVVTEKEFAAFWETLARKNKVFAKF